MTFNPHARDRYLRLVNWARDRYSKNGVLVLMVGNTPSAFTRIERAAFAKFFR